MLQRRSGNAQGAGQGVYGFHYDEILSSLLQLHALQINLHRTDLETTGMAQFLSAQQ